MPKKSKVEKLAERGHKRLDNVYSVKEEAPGPERSYYDPAKCRFRVASQSRRGNAD